MWIPPSMCVMAEVYHGLREKARPLLNNGVRSIEFGAIVAAILVGNLHPKGLSSTFLLILRPLFFDDPLAGKMVRKGVPHQSGRIFSDRLAWQQRSPPLDR